MAVRKIDLLGYYSLGLNEIAEKVGLSSPKTIAVVRELDLQDSDEYFKEFTIGSQRWKRYSHRAVKKIQEALPSLDMEDVWRRHKPPGRRRT